MGHQSAAEHQRFGEYLRRIREQRKLSLDAVEELSTGFSERVTKSHLSRIENGRAVPTFPRMFTLSQIYGVPVTSLAERFELELWRQATPEDLAEMEPRDALGQARKLRESGDYIAMLTLVTAVLERLSAADRGPEGDEGPRLMAHLRMFQIDALIHLERYETAKAECEKLLGSEVLDPRDRVLTLLSFIISCYRLGRYTIARMGIEETERRLAELGEEPKLHGILETNRAGICSALGESVEAARTYERAANLYDTVPDPHESCRARINLGQVLIEIRELDRASEILRTALKAAEDGSYERLAALAHSHLGLVAYERGSQTAAEGSFLRSNSLARPRQYLSLVFRNCYYLWLMARERGDVSAAKANERTLKAYLSRIAGEFPEAEAYRKHLAGEK